MGQGTKRTSDALGIHQAARKVYVTESSHILEEGIGYIYFGKDRREELENVGLRKAPQDRAERLQDFLCVDLALVGRGKQKGQLSEVAEESSLMLEALVSWATSGYTGL